MTPLLIHLHIPKNAGTTLSRMIKARLGFWPPSRLLHHVRTLGYYRTVGYRNRLDRIARLGPEAQSQVRFFEAHAGYGLHELLPQPSEYVVMLREPVNRAMSVYGWLRQRGRISESMPLRDFAMDFDHVEQRIWWVDNAQVRYLAGERGDIVNVPVGSVTSEMLETAKGRVDDFLLAGVVEDFDLSVNLLADALGWRHACYARSNITHTANKQTISPGDAEFLRELNSLDLQLYEHARARLHERVNNADQSLRDRVAGFAAENEGWNRRTRPYHAAVNAARTVQRFLRDLRRKVTR